MFYDWRTQKCSSCYRSYIHFTMKQFFTFLTTHFPGNPFGCYWTKKFTSQTSMDTTSSNEEHIPITIQLYCLIVMIIVLFTFIFKQDNQEAITKKQQQKKKKQFYILLRKVIILCWTIIHILICWNKSLCLHDWIIISWFNNNFLLNLFNLCLFLLFLLFFHFLL